MSAPHHYSIRVATQRTGLSAHVIRIWERRYGAVKPVRTDTQRRLYSEEQVERLLLLRTLTEAGHSIGNVAKLPLEKLRGLAKENPASIEKQSPHGPGIDYLERGIKAIQKLDAEELEATLKDANAELGTQALAIRVIGPLTEKIGNLWREGAITAAHEHFATAVLRIFLGHATRQFASAGDGPALVVVTPVGQLHELGALLAGLIAANLGWNVKYLGASLPAAEIAGAVRQSRARAVALSIVYPEDDARLDGELASLRGFLGADVSILVGGRGAPAYRDALKRIDAKVSADIEGFGTMLEGLRRVS